MRVRIYRRDHFPEDQWYRNSYRDSRFALQAKRTYLNNPAILDTHDRDDVFRLDSETLAWVLQIDRT